MSVLITNNKLHENIEEFSKLKKFFNNPQFESKHLGAVINFIATLMIMLLVLSIYNFSHKKDHLDFNSSQIFVSILCSFSLGGSSYKFQNVLRVIFSEANLFLFLSVITMFGGLETLYSKSIYTNAKHYTGSDARFMGVFDILLSVGLMYVYIILITKKIKND